MELKDEGPHISAKKAPGAAILQIVLLDIVFSVDSVITAVGLTQNLITISLAVIVSFVGLLFYAGPIGEFILRHTALKILALAFLVTIGVTLCLEACTSMWTRATSTCRWLRAPRRASTNALHRESQTRGREGKNVASVYDRRWLLPEKTRRQRAAVADRRYNSASAAALTSSVSSSYSGFSSSASSAAAASSATDVSVG